MKATPTEKAAIEGAIYLGMKAQKLSATMELVAVIRPLIHRGIVKIVCRGMANVPTTIDFASLPESFKQRLISEFGVEPDTEIIHIHSLKYSRCQE